MRRAPRPARRFAARWAWLAAACLLLGCGRNEEEARQEGGARQHYRLGARKYRQGDFAGAIATYERALQLDPDLAEAHLDMGIIHDDYVRDKERAIRHYEEYLRLEPGSEKAEMVRRWVRAAEEEKGRPGEPAAPASPERAAEAESADIAASLELQQAREDLAGLRSENEAYIKTIAALREELQLTRERIEGLLAAEAPPAEGAEAAAGDEARQRLAAAVRSLENEKTTLWERYRSEKGDFERTVQRLKDDLARADERSRERDEALRKAAARIDELRREPAPAAASGAERELARLRERAGELDRANALYLKDNKALLQRLLDAEREVKALRARPAERAQPAQESPHVLAKARADAEREREGLRRQYDKRIADLESAHAREKAVLQREILAVRAQATPAAPHVAAAARAAAEREREALRQSYERQLIELRGALEKEKTDGRRELARLREEARLMRVELQKSREDGAK
ncbi:MAG: tetratricopeptide repeat protein, partial [bacterium]|nr:tetratricopeptide repeat protein [bacterium]